MRSAALWLLSLSFFAASALADEREQDRQAQRDAAERLIMLLAETDRGEGARSTRLARLRTPEFAALIETVSDEQRLLGEARVPIDELPLAMGTCETSQRVMAAMLFFDDDAASNSKTEYTFDDPTAAALADRNTVLFQDELAQLQPFLFRCLARVIPTLTDFVERQGLESLTTQQRDGLKQVRGGVVMVYTGATPVLGTETLRDHYKRSVLSSIAETADVYASVSRPSDREKILADVRALRARAPAAHAADLDRIIAAFGSAECVGLCAIE
jgi:hypothetical protein